MQYLPRTELHQGGSDAPDRREPVCTFGTDGRRGPGAGGRAGEAQRADGQ
jgi:hypothetical protein